MQVGMEGAQAGTHFLLRYALQGLSIWGLTPGPGGHGPCHWGLRPLDLPPVPLTGQSPNLLRPACVGLGAMQGLWELSLALGRGSLSTHLPPDPPVWWAVA